MEKTFWVYIMASHPRTGVLYIGMTGFLAQRYAQHTGQIGGGSAFAKRYQTDQLVYLESFNSPQAAIKRETQLKRWNRQWKVELIESKNPEWVDLSQDLANWI